MLRWRIVLGVLFAGVLLLLAWLDARSPVPGAWLLPVALVVALLGTDELSRMFGNRLPRRLGLTVYLGNALIVASSILPYFAPALGGQATILAAAAALLMVIAAEVLRYRAPARQSEQLAVSALALLYIGLLLSFAVQLRFCGPDGAWGIVAIASLLVVVKSSDIGAYVVGRLFGRHKLAPSLSPGKTIEGAAGGLAFSVFTAWLALVLLPARIGAASAPHLAVWQWVGFGLTVGAAGMIGDLAESLLKRDLGRKDSSDWMPGFGGVLDLLDSVLVAAPVAYAWWQFAFPAA